jgi:hypothetical protein
MQVFAKGSSMGESCTGTFPYYITSNWTDVEALRVMIFGDKFDTGPAISRRTKNCKIEMSTSNDTTVINVTGPAILCSTNITTGQQDCDKKMDHVEANFVIKNSIKVGRWHTCAGDNMFALYNAGIINYSTKITLPNYSVSTLIVNNQPAKTVITHGEDFDSSIQTNTNNSVVSVFMQNNYHNIVFKNNSYKNSSVNIICDFDLNGLENSKY